MDPPGWPQAPASHHTNPVKRGAIKEENTQQRAEPFLQGYASRGSGLSLKAWRDYKAQVRAAVECRPYYEGSGRAGLLLRFLAARAQKRWVIPITTAIRKKPAFWELGRLALRSGRCRRW